LVICEVHLLQLVVCRKLAEKNQVGCFEVVAFFGQLLDRIAAIEQDAFVAGRCR